jgi:hypothetical protein
LLRAVNPYYKHIIIDDSSETVTQMEAISNNLLANATQVTDAVSINIDQIVQSDIAGVRFNNNTVVESNTSSSVNTTSSEVIDILGAVMVTNFNTYTDNVGHSAVLDSLRQTLEISTEVPVTNRSSTTSPISQNNNLSSAAAQTSGTSTVYSPICIQRQDEPISEFGTNHEIFYGAFPHLFLLGKGFPGTGTIPNKNIQHMLLQFTAAFAQVINSIIIYNYLLFTFF